MAMLRLLFRAGQTAEPRLFRRQNAGLGLCLAVLVASLPARAAFAEATAARASSPLAVDDECVRGTSGAEGECGLNALQLRSLKVHAAYRSEAVVATAKAAKAAHTAIVAPTVVPKSAKNSSEEEGTVPAFGTCGGDANYKGQTKCTEGYACAHETQWYAQCKQEDLVAHEVYTGNAELNEPSEAPVMSFYMYRAAGIKEHEFKNVNAGTLGGMMWYVHNEVVSCIYQDCDYARRYGITRIVRFRVKTRATQPLYKAGMNFGLRYAFDIGQCTGPWDCNEQFQKYGYFVGCNDIQSGFPFPTWPVYYNGSWFSLPGSCSEKRYEHQWLECQQDQPGGLCKGVPKGTGTCTYSYEKAGEITLDELENITDYPAFKEEGGAEYNLTTDRGINMTFWDGINDTQANARRVRAAEELFNKKYPHMPRDSDIPPPRCDFDKEKFFPEGVTQLRENGHNHPVPVTMRKAGIHVHHGHR